MSPPPDRLATLDTVRGVAVMGILLLNIISMAMPGYAYVDPYFYGGADGLNRSIWAAVYVLADGKMRGLFTMLFGAGLVLIAERALARGERPARVHYARMVWLFVFGMLHAWLIWYGDILVLYSVTGAMMFGVWRWRSEALVKLAVVLLAVKLVLGVANYGALRHFEAAAAVPGASAEAVARWRGLHAALAPPSADVAAREVAAYRGSFADAFAARAPMTIMFQTKVGPAYLLDTLALIALGMALFRSGFLAGEWPRRTYVRLAVLAPLLTIPPYLPLVAWIDASRFSPMVLGLAETLQLTLLRPPLALGYAAAVILLVESGRLPRLVARIAAAGRMAFTNYLATSILVTLLFNGYGLGWYGYLARWQCYLVVAGMWALMLLWSKPWLDRFAFGPFEWLWRSLARGSPQQIWRKVIAT